MDKPYFYLGADRTAPKGPHTLTELSSMMLRGELTPATEIAAEGDTHWQPLGTVLMAHSTESPKLPPIPQQQDSLPPVPGFDTPAQAPVFPPPAVRIPTPVPGSMWADVWYALQHPFQWRGRALRREFWGTWLVYLLLIVPLTVVVLVTFCIGTAKALDNTSVLSTWAEHPAMQIPWIALGLLAAVMLYFWLVLLAATARRLHDMGRSAWWLVASVLVSLAWQVLYFTRVWAEIAAVNWSLLLNIEDDTSRNARLEEVINRIETIGYNDWGAALYLLNLVLGIIIFICTVSDSQPGTNKYGASVKYPSK